MPSGTDSDVPGWFDQFDGHVMNQVSEWFGAKSNAFHRGIWMASDPYGSRMTVSYVDGRFILYDELFESNDARRPPYLWTDDPGTLLRCALYVSNFRYRSREFLPQIAVEALNAEQSGVLIRDSNSGSTLTHFVRDGREHFAAFSLGGIHAFRRYVHVPVSELIRTLSTQDELRIFSGDPRQITAEARQIFDKSIKIPPPGSSAVLAESGRAGTRDLLWYLDKVARWRSGHDVFGLKAGSEIPRAAVRSEVDRLRIFADGQEPRPGGTPLFGDYWFLAKSDTAQQLNGEPAPGAVQDFVKATRGELVAQSTSHYLVAACTDTSPNQLYLVNGNDGAASLWAPSVGDGLERIIRLYREDCVYWERGTAKDGSQDSLRPMNAFLQKYLEMAKDLPEPGPDENALQICERVIPFLGVIGVQTTKCGRSWHAQAGTSEIKWQTGDGVPESVLVSTQIGAVEFANGGAAARWILYTSIDGVRAQAREHSDREGEPLDVPKPRSNEIRRTGGEGAPYRSYGRQSLVEILGYFGLPLFKEVPRSGIQH